ncbi:MAG: hypothetical protein Q9213_006167 [Squamulea squamosa]
MSLEEAKAFYKRLIPIAKGEVLPDRTDPYEWITYDAWAGMRAVDEALTEATFEGAVICFSGQFNEARSSCVSMGSVLKQRVQEGGAGFVTALMRYSMGLKVSAEAINTILDVSKSYSRLAIVVNDIYSCDKELRAWNRNQKEGGQLVNMVMQQAKDTGLNWEAAKRVLWILCREWELDHFEMVAKREAAVEGCDEDLRRYMEGLEYVLGGNEEWSSYSQSPCCMVALGNIDRPRGAEPLNQTPLVTEQMDTESQPAVPRASISMQEATSFDMFKKSCAEHGLLDRPAGMSSDDVRDGINDDATLLRFLCARKHDVRGALRQFHEAYTARQVNQVCVFYENMEIKDYEETQIIYPQWTGRCDKRGLPVCTFDVSKLDSQTMAAHRRSSLSIPNPSSTDPKVSGVVSAESLRSFALFDSLTRFIMPLCSAIPGRTGAVEPVTKTLVLADISGLDMRQFWRLKGYIQDLNKLLAINYPEILDRVLIVGAPSYFSIMWKWIKAWIDPVTVSKLVILSPEEVLPTMKEYIDIANIPRRFGGELDHEHGMEVLLDPAISEVLTWTPAANSSLPSGPIKWIEGSEKSRIAVAVGKEGGKARSQKSDAETWSRYWYPIGERAVEATTVHQMSDASPLPSKRKTTPPPQTNDEHAAKKPKTKDDISFCGNPIVTLLIGPDSLPFHVHKDLLCEKSPFFAAAFNGSFQESSGSIELKEDRVDDIECIIHWLYRRSFTATTILDKVDVDRHYERLTRLYTTADRFDIAKFKNVIMKTLISRITDPKRNIRDTVSGHTMCPPWPSIAYVYASTARGSPMRRFMAACTMSANGFSSSKRKAEMSEANNGAAAKTPKTIERLSFRDNPMVTLTVGQDKGVFHLPSMEASKKTQATWFSRMTISKPLSCLFNGSTSSCTTAAIKGHFDELTHLYVLADKYDIVSLKNHVMDICFAFARKRGMTTGEKSLAAAPRLETIQYVYNNTVPGLPMRRFMVAYYVWVIRPEWYRQENASAQLRAIPDFAVDVAIALASKFNDDPSISPFEDNSFFHERTIVKTEPDGSDTQGTPTKRQQVSPKSQTSPARRLSSRIRQ